MQSLLRATNSAPSFDCASDLVDTVPLVMRVIRQHLRRHRSGLTVPQFRSLWFISTAAGHSLSAVADFIGLSLPAMSRLMDGLVDQKLVHRKTCNADRRHVRLSLTPSGEATLGEARELARAHIAESLSRLTERERSTVGAAMKILRTAFTPELTTADGIEPAADEEKR
ncbi:MAG: putative MarR family transcriptional regulator [Phycisphaerales bacterium]|nr:putative MarR family transcriptional regulator [Phycisphaerales bacterium]